jgi:curli biogenesis system outer membrane secretion channel CsgG
VASQTVASHGTAYSGPKYTLVVGNFQNRSSYMRGLFSDGLDRLGNQAKTILKTHLQQTNRFTVVDRDNMEELAQEASLRGEQQRLRGAEVAITGTSPSSAGARPATSSSSAFSARARRSWPMPRSRSTSSM